MHVEYRRRGLGAYLIEKSVQYISKQGKYQHVSLNVNTINSGAIKLYQKCGFYIQHKIKDFYPYSHMKHAYTMKRDLITSNTSNHSIYNGNGHNTRNHGRFNDNILLLTTSGYSGKRSNGKNGYNNNNIQNNIQQNYTYNQHEHTQTNSKRISSLRLSLQSLSSSSNRSPSSAIYSPSFHTNNTNNTPFISRNNHILSPTLSVTTPSLKDIIMELTPPATQLSPSPDCVNIYKNKKHDNGDGRTICDKVGKYDAFTTKMVHEIDDLLQLIDIYLDM